MLYSPATESIVKPNAPHPQEKGGGGGYVS